MKKVLVLLLAAAMIFTFAACAPSSSTPSATTEMFRQKRPNQPSQANLPKTKKSNCLRMGVIPKKPSKWGLSIMTPRQSRSWLFRNISNTCRPASISKSFGRNP